jgi:hypothetical protein
VKPENAKAEFERFVRASGKHVELLRPREAIEVMLEFFRSVRAEGCSMERDGDMLLFQWGVYERGGRNRFIFYVTRQLIPERGDDEDIWQLSLTFTFDPLPNLESIGNGNRWCESLDAVDEFEKFVRSHPATVATGERSDAKPALTYDCAG